MERQLSYSVQKLFQYLPFVFPKEFWWTLMAQRKSWTHSKNRMRLQCCQILFLTNIVSSPFWDICTTVLSVLFVNGGSQTNRCEILHLSGKTLDTAVFRFCSNLDFGNNDVQNEPRTVCSPCNASDLPQLKRRFGTFPLCFAKNFDWHWWYR